MYDDIDIDEKVRYLNEIGYNIVDNFTMKSELEQKIKEILNGEVDTTYDAITEIKAMFEDLDVEDEEAYYDLTDNPYPKKVDVDELDRMFNNEIEDIKEDTSFLEDYPQYDNNNNLKR